MTVTEGNMKKYLFVCTGNTCRSPMAEGILNDIAKKEGLDICAKSAGISVSPGNPPSQNAVEACAELGVDISKHKSSQLTNDLFYEADAVVPLTETHRLIMLDAFKDAEKIMPALGVFDPYGGNIDDYRKCRDMILEKIREITHEDNRS